MSEPDDVDPASLLRRELTDIVREQAVDVAELLITALGERMGGRDVYIPASDKADRDAQIRAMFNGRNLREVMRVFSISRAAVYRALK